MAPRNGFTAAAILALLALPGLVPAAEPARSVSTQADLPALVADLGHEGFARREAATKNLAKAGLSAIEPLVSALGSDNAEIAWRATSALEQIAAKGNDQTTDQLLASLQRLDAAGRPGLAGMVADLTNRQKQLRHGRAVAKIRSLGAETNQSSPTVASTLFLGPGAVIVDFSAEEVLSEVVTIELKALTPAEVAADGDELMLTPVAIADFKDPVALAIEAPIATTEVAVEPAPPPEPAPAPQEGELLDTVSEPEPPPDVLPVTPPGEVPAIEGEIGEAYVGEEVAAEIGGEGPVDPNTFKTDNPITRLTLTAAWRGSDSGVALLKDLPELQQLELEGAQVTDAALEHVAALPNLAFFKVHGTSITANGLRKLHAQKPSLMITAVGQAMLGVSAQADGERCQLTTINPNSGAAQAGLQVGDYVTQVDDAKIASFIDLMIAVFERKAGDKLNVQYERGGVQKTAIVELQTRNVPPTIDR